MIVSCNPACRIVTTNLFVCEISYSDVKHAFYFSILAWTSFQNNIARMLKLDCANDIDLFLRRSADYSLSNSASLSFFFFLLQSSSLSSSCYRHIGSYTCSSDWQRNRGVPYRTNCTLLSSCAVALTARNSRGVVKSTSCRFTVPLSVCCLLLLFYWRLKFPTIFQSKSKC